MSTQVEERVRRALSARAGQITPDQLRPAVPPTAAPARRSWLPWWRPLLVVAAVLVAVVFVVRRPGEVPPPTVPNAPAVTVPSVSPSVPVTPPTEPVSRSPDAAQVPTPATSVPVPKATTVTDPPATPDLPATSPTAVR